MVEEKTPKGTVHVLSYGDLLIEDGIPFGPEYDYRDSIISAQLSPVDRENLLRIYSADELQELIDCGWIGFRQDASTIVRSSLGSPNIYLLDQIPPLSDPELSAFANLAIQFARVVTGRRARRDIAIDSRDLIPDSIRRRVDPKNPLRVDYVVGILNEKLATTGFEIVYRRGSGYTLVYREYNAISF